VKNQKMLRFMAADAAKGKQDGTGDGQSSPTKGESATIHATAAQHPYRGDRVCTNNLLVSRMALEEQLLGGLHAKVLRPDVVEYAFRRFEENLGRLMSRQSRVTLAVRRRAELVERQIRNCTEAFASMGLSGVLRVHLTSLKTPHRELTEKRASAEPRAERLQLWHTRRFVEARLKNLQSMLTGEARLVRAEIAKYVEKITLTQGGGISRRRSICTKKDFDSP
jgi:hypothetical protein